jgi:hypothetical protein
MDFFYYIPHSSATRPRTETKAAIIRVIKGKLSSTQVQAEMQRLVPAQSTWVIEELGKNRFKTFFLMKSEKNRIEWGVVQTKDRKAKLQIKEVNGCNINKQSMRKVWVQVTKLPGELRDYLTIWAIGTILGVTKDVDMVFTRKFNRARLQVLVLDPALILTSCDVVIGYDIYELLFKVEPEEMSDQPVLLDMDDGFDDMGHMESEEDEAWHDLLQEDSGPMGGASGGTLEVHQSSTE